MRFPCEPLQCTSFFRRMCFAELVGACSLGMDVEERFVKSFIKKPKEGREIR